MRAALLNPIGVCVLTSSLLVANLWSYVPGLTTLAVAPSWLVFWGIAGYVVVTLLRMWPVTGEAASAQTGNADVQINWSNDAVARQVRADSLRQPTTLLPLAGAALLIAHALLIARPEPRLWEAVLGVSGLALAAGSFLWSSVVRYSDHHEAHVTAAMRDLEVERASRDAAWVERLQHRLQDGFSLVKSDVGAGTLQRLDDAFAQLQPVLRDRRAADPISLNLVPGLAEETFRRGLSVLDDALELMRATYGVDGSFLQEQVQQLEALLAVPEGGDERRALQEQRLAMYRQRLEGQERLRLDIDRLLYQADRCEASLYESRLALAAIRAGTTEQSLGSVIEALRRTVQQARATQDELRQMAQ